MDSKDKEHIRNLANKHGLPEEVILAIIRSPYEFIRNNSKDLTSVRIPMFGLFAVKPNRIKNINERKNAKRDKEA